MERVQQWKSANGRTYDTKQAAAAGDAEQGLTDWLRAALSAEFDPDMIAKTITADFDNFAAVVKAIEAARKRAAAPPRTRKAKAPAA